MVVALSGSSNSRQDPLTRGDDGGRGDPELAEEDRPRGARPERRQPNDLSLQAHVMLPPQPDPGLDRHPRPDRGREDVIPVRSRLTVK